MNRTNGEWIRAIARRAATSTDRVEGLLAAHHISAAPVLPQPRRLLLTEVAFSGVKDRSGAEEPFDFVWSDLEHGLWAMLSDKNLRGKSSILEVVHWLLRGRPTNKLQEDVRRWIHKAHVRFLLDDGEHEVSIQTPGGLRGKLTLRAQNGKRAITKAEFVTEDDFEAVMADFFMSALSIDAITNWQTNTSNEDNAGQAISHSWVAFSGAMFIGTNYDTLLGNMPVASGLNPRLIQMYVGVPWVSTLASSQSAQKGAQHELDARLRKQAQRQASRRQRETEIESQLATKRLELSTLPSYEEVRTTIGKWGAELASTANRQRALERDLSSAERAEEEARLLSVADRKELLAHSDAMAAGAVFRMLDPTFCPRCDTAISETKKKQEQTTHECSVCGEVTESDDDAQMIKDALESRVKASRAAYDAATEIANELRTEHTNVQERAESLQVLMELETSKLDSFDLQQKLTIEIATLEGRLAETRRGGEPTEDSLKSDNLAVLGAIMTETENRVNAVRDDLLRDVSGRIVHYAQRFGMHTLTEATLKANAALSLVKGGTSTSYSKVTDGEKLRLKVATILAMIEIGEQKGVGRHPGLLMIDSPGAQEVSQADLEALIKGLQSVAKDIPHCQIFVAARSSEAITQYVPVENRKEAVNGGFLW